MEDQHDANNRELPSEVNRYFDSVRKNDLDEFTECFAPGALVVDVDRQIVGKSAIRQWGENEVMGGSYQIADVEAGAGRAQVLLDFAPKGAESFRARYVFRLAAGAIASMRLQHA